MRTKQLLLALLLVHISAFGQDTITVKGRIVNQQGEPVEYVQVGIPKLQTGTISTADGHFEISVPKDTLEFFHVSYQTGSYVVTGPEDDVVIVLAENELPPAVSSSGNTREKYLLRSGTRIFGNVLQKPIYVNVAESGKSQEFHIQPEEIDTVRDRSDSLLARAARSADGIVEAYETDHIMAIQSHPEKMIQQGDEKWLALFREFVKGCK